MRACSVYANRDAGLFVPHGVVVVLGSWQELRSVTPAKCSGRICLGLLKCTCLSLEDRTYCSGPRGSVFIPHGMRSQSSAAQRV